MALSLLGLNNPIGILFSALVFAILRIGGISMPLTCERFQQSYRLVRIYHLFVGANYLMEVIVDKFPQFGEEKGVMRNGFSNTFTSSCREHAPLLNTADLTALGYRRSGIVNIGLEGTTVIGCLCLNRLQLSVCFTIWFMDAMGCSNCSGGAGMLYSSIHAHSQQYTACRPYYFWDGVKLTSTSLNGVPVPLNV